VVKQTTKYFKFEIFQVASLCLDDSFAQSPSLGVKEQQYHDLMIPYIQWKSHFKNRRLVPSSLAQETLRARNRLVDTMLQVS
jgi:hypothetical protein